MRSSTLFTVSCGLVALVSAKSVPENVRTFYNGVKNGDCANQLATGFYNTPDSSGSWSYCQANVTGDQSVIFLRGASGFANMDVDCDGAQFEGDGRCKSSSDTQPQTSFIDKIASYNKPGVSDLNAYIHPYVVFGNIGKYSPTFDPQQYGIEPLSVMAVVCGDNLIYGVWGDTNGDDDEKPLVGEASLALATACFGTGVSGGSGYDGTGVLYVAFAGKNAVPGADGARWEATNYDDFESSIEQLGDSLVQQLSCEGDTCSGGQVVARSVSGGSNFRDRVGYASWLAFSGCLLGYLFL